LKSSSVRRLDAREIAVTAIMTATTAALTMVVSVPFPPTRGYFNFGDVMVMLSGLLFGARVGGLAGGIGSALADLLLGFSYFAPLTLMIKGLEGFLTGLIGHNRKLPFKVAAVIAGAAAMLIGYFSVETPLFGLGPAFTELATINSIQVTVGATFSLVLAGIIVRTYPDLKSFQRQPTGLRSAAYAMVAVGIVLTAIVLLYVMTGVFR